MADIPNPATTEWVPIWNALSEGPVGPPGPAGPSTSVLFYRADITTQAANDPGSGRMRWNHATQSLATALYLDRLTDDNFDAMLFLKLSQMHDTFAIQDAALSANYQVWEQTGPAIDHADWFEVPVVLQSTGGVGVFSQLQRVAFLIKAEGAEGPMGPPGPQGPQGDVGPEGPQGDPGSTVAHAPTHSAAAGDPVDVKALAGYPGGTANFLRADGTFAAPPGGALPPNIAYTNVGNVFTKEQHLAGGEHGDQRLFLELNTNPVDKKKWLFHVNPSGNFYIGGFNDAETAWSAIALTLDRSGVVTTGAALNTTGFIYPGRVHGPAGVQSSYYLAGSDSYGLHSNTGLHLTGSLWTDATVQSVGYIYPGRFDAPGNGQTSWYIAGHGSYGLYVNTGLYVAGQVWPVGGLDPNYLLRSVPTTDVGFDPNNFYQHGVWWTINTQHAYYYMIYNNVMTIWIMVEATVHTTASYLLFRVPAGRLGSRFSQNYAIFGPPIISVGAPYDSYFQVHPSDPWVYILNTSGSIPPGNYRIEGQIQVPLT